MDLSKPFKRELGNLALLLLSYSGTYPPLNLDESPTVTYHGKHITVTKHGDRLDITDNRKVKKYSLVYYAYPPAIPLDPFCCTLSTMWVSHFINDLYHMVHDNNLQSSNIEARVQAFRREFEGIVLTPEERIQTFTS